MKDKTWQLGEAWPFKKYRDQGMTVEMVILTDPKYVLWCMENLRDFYLSEGCKQVLNERLREGD
ncbi:MAG: hypothetical protein A2V66_03630 [Ignavibacteria bacterium RBG_13_36_8]|nr:MAG: hypothetical protein A2V66_03630 [Ignavibacteria bacterium RBG_13_36_8]